MTEKKMSNLKLRILLIFVAVPLLFSIAIFLPYFNYLAISLVAAFFIISGTYETWKLFYGKCKKGDYVFVTIIAYSIPAIVYLESANFLPYNTVYCFLGILIFIIFIFQVFNRNESTYPEINRRTSSLIVLLFYPGIFFSYSIRFSTLHYPSFAFILFLFLVFFNDICAYVSGMLWGANNRNIIPISPKKSLVGFIVGFSSSILVASVFYYFKPQFFAEKYHYALIMGIVIGIISIIGDLSESAMKRSANIKDSGNVLPGRGGILDNIDSLIFSAPAFYFMVKYIIVYG
ncbi:MAG: phosphatidate cytidylyltransferase [Spirochaetaceae bacterium]|nr:phosphatidate cytidylyltransferase [Spirochaetaceae bacterium]